MRFKKVGNIVVFDNGKIWKEYNEKCSLVKPCYNKKGYQENRINGKKTLIHRLVAELFYYKSDLTVDHKDGNKRNNDISNLEYVTSSENVKRAYKSGIHNERICNMKKRILWNEKEFSSLTELSSYLGLSKFAASRAKNKKCKLKGHHIYEY